MYTSKLKIHLYFYGKHKVHIRIVKIWYIGFPLLYKNSLNALTEPCFYVLVYASFWNYFSFDKSHEYYEEKLYTKNCSSLYKILYRQKPLKIGEWGGKIRNSLFWEGKNLKA